jgi:hypothetical protein
MPPYAYASGVWRLASGVGVVRCAKLCVVRCALLLLCSLLSALWCLCLCLCLVLGSLPFLVTGRYVRFIAFFFGDVVFFYA